MSKGVIRWLKSRRTLLLVLAILGVMGALVRSGVDRIREAAARTNSV